MRHIGLDARMIEHSGIGTYVRHLAQGLADGHDSRQDLVLRYYGNPSNLNKFLPNVSAQSLRRFDAPIYSVKEHWSFACLKKEWDIWHCPHYNVPFVKKGMLVVTVHDLIHLVFQGKYFNALQGWYARQSLNLVRKNADAIIAVSHHTKKDLVELAGIPESRITVIHEGVGKEFQPIEDQRALASLKIKFNLPKKFLLYVGNIKPHKNVGQLSRVFLRLKQKSKIEEDLVLVGQPDKKWINQDKDLRAAAKDNAVHFLSKVPLQDLPGLYSMATAVVLPSLYEGFGLVVLEAMACGTPVIVSNRASLPEIAGDAAKVFDPQSDGALDEAIELVSGDINCRKIMTINGIQRANQFSWNKMVDATVSIYRNMGELAQ